MNKINFPGEKPMVKTAQEIFDEAMKGQVFIVEYKGEKNLVMKSSSEYLFDLCSGYLWKNADKLFTTEKLTPVNIEINILP